MNGGWNENGELTGESGMSGMLKYIGTNLKPVGSPDLSGIVLVKMIIDTDGTVPMVFIQNPLKKEKENEAIRVCRSMVFTPATVNNKAIRVFEETPIRFMAKK